MYEKMSLFLIPVQQQMVRCAIRSYVGWFGEMDEQVSIHRLYEKISNIYGFVHLSKIEIEFMILAIQTKLLFLKVLEKHAEHTHYQALVSYLYAYTLYWENHSKEEHPLSHISHDEKTVS